MMQCSGGQREALSHFTGLAQPILPRAIFTPSHASTLRHSDPLCISDLDFESQVSRRSCHGFETIVLMVDGKEMHFNI